MWKAYTYGDISTKINLLEVYESIDPSRIWYQSSSPSWVEVNVQNALAIIKMSSYGVNHMSMDPLAIGIVSTALWKYQLNWILE